jgi:hypothetical protein
MSTVEETYKNDTPRPGRPWRIEINRFRVVYLPQKTASGTNPVHGIPVTKNPLSFDCQLEPATPDSAFSFFSLPIIISSTDFLPPYHHRGGKSVHPRNCAYLYPPIIRHLSSIGF